MLVVLQSIGVSWKFQFIFRTVSSRFRTNRQIIMHFKKFIHTPYIFDLLHLSLVSHLLHPYISQRLDIVCDSILFFV